MQVALPGSLVEVALLVLNTAGMLLQIIFQLLIISQLLMILLFIITGNQHCRCAAAVDTSVPMPLPVAVPAPFFELVELIRLKKSLFI